MRCVTRCVTQLSDAPPVLRVGLVAATRCCARLADRYSGRDRKPTWCRRRPVVRAARCAHSDVDRCRPDREDLVPVWRAARSELTGLGPHGRVGDHRGDLGCVSTANIVHRCRRGGASALCGDGHRRDDPGVLPHRSAPFPSRPPRSGDGGDCAVRTQWGESARTAPLPPDAGAGGGELGVGPRTAFACRNRVPCAVQPDREIGRSRAERTTSRAPACIALRQGLRISESSGRAPRGPGEHATNPTRRTLPSSVSTRRQVIHRAS